MQTSIPYSYFNTCRCSKKIFGLKIETKNNTCKTLPWSRGRTRDHLPIGIRWCQTLNPDGNSDTLDRVQFILYIKCIIIYLVTAQKEPDLKMKQIYIVTDLTYTGIEPATTRCTARCCNHLSNRRFIPWLTIQNV